jgi:hypothetical protein
MRPGRAFVVILFGLIVWTAPVPAQLENVGNLSFPTSGSPDAQRHFLRGVAILHSFGWKQAIGEFKLAQAAQPDFAMAYWGETLCYNHPLNAEQDAKNPRAILSRLWPGRRRRARRASCAPSRSSGARATGARVASATCRRWRGCMRHFRRTMK